MYALDASGNTRSGNATSRHDGSSSPTQVGINPRRQRMEESKPLIQVAPKSGPPRSFRMMWIRSIFRS